MWIINNILFTFIFVITIAYLISFSKIFHMYFPLFVSIIYFNKKIFIYKICIVIQLYTITYVVYYTFDIVTSTTNLITFQCWSIQDVRTKVSRFITVPRIVRVFSTLGGNYTSSDRLLVWKRRKLIVSHYRSQERCVIISYLNETT